MKHQRLKKRCEEVREIAKLGFWEWDIIRDNLVWSDEIYTLFETRKSSEALSYDDFLGFVHPDDRRAVMRAVRDAVGSAAKPYDIRHRIITASGKERYLRERAEIQSDEFGSPLFMIGTVQDVSDNVAKEAALREALDEALLFRELLDKSSEAIYIFDPRDGRILECNERAREMLGYGRDALLGQSVRSIEMTYKKACDWERYVSRLEMGKALVTEGIHRRRDGTTFPVESSVSLTKNGRKRVVAIVRDISERKAVESELYQYREGLEALVAQRTAELHELNRTLETYIRVVDNNVLTSSTDAEGVITYVSDAFCKTSGYSEEELLGKKHNILRHPDMPDEIFVQMWGTITQGKNWQGELKNRRKDGSALWIEMTIEPTFDEEQAIVGYTAIRHDIGDKKRIEELTHTDPLTGVYNRRFFYEIMDKELRRTVRYGRRLCFAMIDIDFFKNYNDTYGHYEGDRVLVSVCDRIKSLLRRGDDYLFRLGGEEFGIVCHCPDTSVLGEYAERIRKSVEGMRIDHSASGVSSYVTISIGVTIVRPERQVTLDEIYIKADRALYKAKNEGRNRTVISEFGG